MRWRAALLAGSIGLGALGTGWATSDIAAKEAELRRLKERIESIRQRLESDEARQGGVIAQLRDLERKIGSVDNEVRRIRADLDESRERLRDLERRRAEQQRRLETQREVLASQIRSSFVMGRQEQVKLLLNQRDPATVHRSFTYYDYMHRARTAAINASIDQLRRLRETETAILRERERLDRLLDQRERAKLALEQSREERGGVLRSLNQRIESGDKEIAQLTRSAEALQELLESLQRALADIPDSADPGRPFADGKGSYPWPVRGAVRDLRQASQGQGGGRWNGVLIEAPAGSEVRTVAGGRVAFSDWLRGVGLLAIIDHGDGFMTLYGHNRALYRETGDWVAAGDVIASVGDSGGRRKPGLYFEIRHEGRPEAPQRWCRSGVDFVRN